MSVEINVTFLLGGSSYSITAKSETEEQCVSAIIRMKDALDFGTSDKPKASPAGPA